VGPESALNPLHVEVLPQVQREVLAALGGSATREGFHLAGGTAVAIHLGHRQSIDFDWFTPSALPDPLALVERLRAAAPGLQMTSIAPGTLLGQHGLGLRTMLQLYQEKYGTGDVAHVLAGLSYTDDAEQEPMPVLLAPIDWNEVKAALRSWVKEFAAG
jgi:hypothetical protein